MDVKAIQEQLAVSLDLKFGEGDDRAFRLRTRLENGEKILVVLDDVWKKIPLDGIGIPFGYGSFKGCKILLTSREKEVCLHNNCHNPIEIEILNADEAWDLFKDIVGTSNFVRVGERLARDVCKECGGLPLIINAIGEALKFKTQATWEDSLNLLQNCQFQNIPGIDGKVYVCLKVSFDQLHKYAKACLFLCSFFDEDYEISVEKELLILASATELLKDGIDTIEDARKRVVSSVNLLKSSSLLIECDDEDEFKVKVHDIIRDVASSIAKEEREYAFLTKRNLSSWPRSDDCGAMKLLRLTFDKQVHDLSDQKLVCPNLHTLWLEGNNYMRLPDDCLTELANLRSLFLQGLSLYSKKSSLQIPSNLRVLCLHKCGLSGNHILPLKGLEILILNDCMLPMPLDLQGLNRLQMLKLRNMEWEGIVVVRHVISSLSKLEELCIPSKFRILDGATNKEVPIFEEINQLTHLTNLEIQVKDDMSFPNDSIVYNLRRFRIRIGDMYHLRWSEVSTQANVIEMNSGCLTSGLKALAEKAEGVTFHDVTGLRDVFVNNSNREEAFKDLTELQLYACHEMEHLDGMPFHKLRVLKLQGCSRLKYMFSASSARCLMLLNSLEVHDCEVMEEIIRNEEEEDIIDLPSLKRISLENLPSLTNFYRQKTTPNHSRSLFNKVAFPNLEIIEVTKLSISTLFTLSHITKSLKLTHIKVCICGSLQEIVRDESPVDLDHEDIIMFPKLTYLDLDDLPKVTTFYHQKGPLNYSQSLFSKVAFLNMERIEVRKLSISTIFTLCDITKNLQQLKRIKVSICGSLEEIVRDEGPIDRDHENILVLPRLTFLELDDLPKVTTFYRQKGPPNHSQSLFNKVAFPN